MDRSYEGALDETPQLPPSRLSLRKKKSVVHVRPDSSDDQYKMPALASLGVDESSIDHIGELNQQKHAGPGQRKGSLRHVVRKIFRRSKRIETNENPPNKLQRHQYHRSEPNGVPPIFEHTQRTEYEELRDDPAHHRVLSAPLHIEIPTVEHQRIRSPYAVEFPKSARLKPIDLGSPFDAPGSSLRRRKTLPSILLADEDASAVSEVAKSPTVPPIPGRKSTDGVRQTPTPEIGLALSGSRRNSRRRSRSVGGYFGRDSGLPSPPQRKRSEEIRFWRDSYQGNAPRARSFVVSPLVEPQQTDGAYVEEEKRKDSAMPNGEDEDVSQGLGILTQSSISREGTLATLEGSPSDPPYDASARSSGDLEGRVAKLEANLRTFQASLHKLQADRNRRTVIVGDYASSVNPSNAHQSIRTPSMLADDLYLKPESRPSTAPHRRTPSDDPDAPPIPPLPGSPQRPTTSSRNPSPNYSTNSNVTFRSLYQMLSDERSARRKLETNLRGLQTEIHNLQNQVATSPGFVHGTAFAGQQRGQEQHWQGEDDDAESGSFHSAHYTRYSHERDDDVDESSRPQSAVAASSRLRDLMRETERERCMARDGQGSWFESRFSGSTVKGGAPILVDDEDGRYDGEDEEDEEEAQTPYEAYQTPREESGAFWGRSGMF